MARSDWSLVRFSANRIAGVVSSTAQTNNQRIVASYEASALTGAEISYKSVMSPTVTDVTISPVVS
jgi:hypothetical protein